MFKLNFKYETVGCSNLGPEIFKIYAVAAGDVDASVFSDCLRISRETHRNQHKVVAGEFLVSGRNKDRGD